MRRRHRRRHQGAGGELGVVNEMALERSHSLLAVVNAAAHIHIKPPRFTKQRFVAGGAAAVAVAGTVVLRIRLRLHSDP